MQVTIDDKSGFCFGVLYAIEMAENILVKDNHLFCLGDIVHNDKEVDRLNKMGLEIIDHDKLKSLKDCKVLIRAHGEPPETYKIALENNLQLIDASCPVVLKLQHQVKEGFEHSSDICGQIVIYGKEGHAEVKGLLGQTKGKAIVVASKDDLYKIDFTQPIFIYSQTTKSPNDYKEITDEIDKRLKMQKNHSEIKYIVNDTLCRQVSNREPQLRKFSIENDVIVFVSGQKSSNGKMLYNACKSENPNSFFVSDTGEINQEWFENSKKVGICGATSTPRWLMEKVADRIKEIVN
jgi:4-hydroxy-3-methylbut-2-enyl diphosphate reductase